MKLYRLICKPPPPFSVSSWITDDDEPIQAGPNARSAVMIPLLIAQYGSLLSKLRSFRVLFRYLSRSMGGLIRSAYQIRRNPHVGTRSIDDETLAEFEALARNLGVTRIGYTCVNPDHIFRGFEILYDNAIMLTIEMDRGRMASNPSLEATTEIHRTYAELGEAVNELAAFLRRRGFDCHASPAIGGDINTVPTAQDANLGHIGKNGLLITPDHGPCVRLAAVFVDIDNLPMAKGNDHAWIPSFCDTCNLCVRACPGGAIYAEPTVNEAGERVFIDREKCAPPFSEGCSQCITSCPFTSGRYDRIHEVFLRRHPDLAALSGT